MTEQPPDGHDDHDDHAGCDHATEEQRVARAHRSNNLVNALITSRDDLQQAAQIVEDTINEFGIVDAEETIRMLANAMIGFTNRIQRYARIMNRLAGDELFDRYHAEAVLSQAANPIIQRLDNHGHNPKDHEGEA